MRYFNNCSELSFNCEVEVVVEVKLHGSYIQISESQPFDKFDKIFLINIFGTYAVPCVMQYFL